MKLTLYLILYCYLLPPSGASQVTEILAWQGERAVLPCVLRNEKFSLSTNTFSWQRGKIVIYSFENGGPKEDDMDSLYKGRTSSAGDVSVGDLSLLIRNVRVNDQGEYNCHLFTNQPDMMKIYDYPVQLKVTANYRRPVIEGPGSESTAEGRAINLTCLSWGGYPEASVSWTDGEGRPLPNTSQDDQPNADPVSGLWNVSSQIQVEPTSNSSYICSVLNPRTGERRSSAPWHAAFPVVETPSALQQGHVAGITVGCILPLVLVLAAVGLVKWKRHHRLHQGVPTTEEFECEQS